MAWLPLTSAKMALPSEHDTGNLVAMLGRKKSSWAIKVADEEDGIALGKLLWCDEPSVSGLDRDGAPMTACKDFQLNERSVPGWTVPLEVEANPDSLVPVSAIAWYDARGMVMIGPRGIHICASDKFTKYTMRFVNTATWRVDCGLSQEIGANRYSVSAYFREWRVSAQLKDGPMVVGEFSQAAPS